MIMAIIDIGGTTKIEKKAKRGIPATGVVELNSHPSP
jgi:hypothetical protein